MKIKILVLLYLFAASCYSQTIIDKYVAVRFPAEPEIIDTTLNEQPMRMFLVNLDSEMYMVMRLTIDMSKENPDGVMDENEQNGMYKGLMKGQNKQMRQNGFEILDSNKISIQGYDAYKTRYGRKTDEYGLNETINLILDGKVYTFSYIGVNSFSEERCKDFHNSIAITNAPKPVKPESRSLKIAGIIGEYIGQMLGGLVIVLIIVFAVKRSQKKKSDNEPPQTNGPQ